VVGDMQRVHEEAEEEWSRTPDASNVQRGVKFSNFNLDYALFCFVLFYFSLAFALRGSGVKFCQRQKHNGQFNRK